MLDRETFIRPIAHRGLHNAPSLGLVENTGPAFEAAIAKGYGIECDVRPGQGGLALVFHDKTTSRLMMQDRDVASLSSCDLASLNFRDTNAPLLTFSACLELVAGRVPLIVEVKSDWDAPDPEFVKQLADGANAYRGPIAFKSFDPAYLIALHAVAPATPRGIVSCDYSVVAQWVEKLGRDRCYRLTHLLESGPVAPSFYSYDVKALPTPITRFVREVQHLPLLTWTVKSHDDWKVAKTWADAPVFEGPVPEGW
ncbi:MAG: glycerophosphodiester phosphodiesterase family protein [Hyphomicrobiaceae bacterium]